MSYNFEINKLVNYIENHRDFNVVRSNSCFYNNHLGAILADIILQAGVNYKSVVLPRVLNIYKTYDSAHNLPGTINIVEEIGIENFLNWKNNIKTNRYLSILEFLSEKSIESTYELAEFLTQYENVQMFLSINGIGYKTIDYFRKLMHVETVAVDRHILNFLTKANINFNNYHGAKIIVEYAADILNISRRDIDYSIWYYMSQKQTQMAFTFEY
ncbi:hypothetical protein [Elizabethkingia miricola]|uniref:DNA lyase n=1 Tax=Elizabethkingia miricola TaxID=172045 RepID=A0ABD5B3R0_ELIMR|nr:hypothetical protein [Elizabethkingia miricola]MDQ8747733.1 hypothetical protein [Elizabethkingia miricola]